jgi:Haem-binding domain
MKKALKIIVLLLFVVFVGLQFVRPDFSNPPIVPDQTLEAANIPADVSQVLKRSCYDCHSNATVYPWYSKISPFSGVLANHIKDGRNGLNFSEWGSYAATRKKRKLRSVCENAESKEMPLNSYLWIHRDAKLSDADIKLICDWTDSAVETLSSSEGG